MTLHLYWPCEACGDPADAYEAGAFVLAGQTVCAACVDDMAPIAPPERDPDPRGDAYDRARDQWERDHGG